MTLTTLKTRLETAGLTVESVRVYNHFGVDVPGLRVLHNYDGPCRTDEARQAAARACKIARGAGFRAEDRGISTLIITDRDREVL